MIDNISSINFLAFLLGNKAKLISIEYLNSINLKEKIDDIDILKSKLLDIYNQEIKSYKIKDGDNIGLLLSGGIDSLFLLTLLKQNFPSSKIFTYTLGYKENDGHLEISRTISKKYNTVHKEVIYDLNNKLLEYFDDTYSSGYDLEGEDSLLMNHELAKEVKKDCKHVFSGFGLDYVLAGMDLFRNSFIERLYKRGLVDKKYIFETLNSNKYYLKYVLDKMNEYDESFFLKYGEYYGDILKKEFEEMAIKSFNKKYSTIRNDITTLKKQSYYIIHTSLSNRFNPYNIPYLKQGVTHYNPFGSKNVIEKVIGLNIDDKYLYNTITKEKKYIIREIARDTIDKDILDNLHSGTVLKYDLAIEQNKLLILDLVNKNRKVLDKFLKKEFLDNLDKTIENVVWYEDSKKIIILLQFLFYLKYNPEMINYDISLIEGIKEYELETASVC